MATDNTKALEMYKTIKKLLKVFGACKLNKTQKDFLLTQKKKLQRGKLSDEEKELYEYVISIIEKDDILPIDPKSINVHYKSNFSSDVINNPRDIQKNHIEINLSKENHTDPSVVGMLPCDQRSVDVRNGISVPNKGIIRNQRLR